MKSVNRYLKLLKIGEVFDEGQTEIREIERYGMGKERSVAEFYEQIGVDPNTSFKGDENVMSMEACVQLDMANKEVILYL